MSSPVDPQVADFLMQVNCRYVPAFFLGCVFIAAVNAMNSSSFFQTLFARLRESLSSDELVDSEKVSSDSSVSFCVGECRTLVFLLSFCFASASITFFASLLSFSPDSGVACAFVIAWGGVTSQLARIVGLIILFLELRRLGIQKLESIAFVSLLVVGTVFVFVNQAFATGVTIPFPEWNVSLCDRRHSLATSLVSSLIYILLEGYTICRLWSLLVPEFLRFRHQIVGLEDIRVWQGIALVLFDLLIIVPAAIPTNIIAEFLPFSIGSLIVIWSFCVQPTPPSVDASIVSVPRSASYHTTPVTVRRSVAPTVYSGTPAVTEPSDQLPALLYHPFSFKSLNDPTPEDTEWPVPRTARSSRTIDSISAISIRNAIVQVAKRAVHPFSQELELFPAPPTASTMMTPSSAGFSPIRIATSPTVQTMLPRKAAARPHLMVITSATPDTAQPDSAVLRPLMHKSSLFRLSPTFMPRSHFSMSSDSHSRTTPSRSSLPSSPSVPRSSMMSGAPSMPLSDKQSVKLTRFSAFGT